MRRDLLCAYVGADWDMQSNVGGLRSDPRLQATDGWDVVFRGNRTAGDPPGCGYCAVIVHVPVPVPVPSTDCCECDPPGTFLFIYSGQR